MKKYLFLLLTVVSLSTVVFFANSTSATTPTTPVQMAVTPTVEKFPEEVRAVWVTRWQYKTKEDIVAIMDRLEKNNMNLVFFQVRGEADAFYNSAYEPWSKELTGTLGQKPTFDPLKVAIEEGHKRGIAVHAWLNMMTVWKGKTPPEKTATKLHLYHAHPDWLIADKDGKPMVISEHNYVFLNPANQEVQAYLLKIVRDLVTKYPVDGVHLDYIRFPGAQYGKDDKTYARFQAQKEFTNFDDWRRNELTNFVGKVRVVAKQSKSKPIVSAAVIGYYKDVWGWGYERSGSFDKYLQDSKTWVNKGKVDFITPMVYWKIGAKPDFAVLAKDYADTLDPKKVVIGISTTNFTSDEIFRQVALVEKLALRGFAFFSYETTGKFWLDEEEK